MQPTLNRFSEIILATNAASLNWRSAMSYEQNSKLYPEFGADEGPYFYNEDKHFEHRASSNESAIEVVDPQPIDPGYERIEYHRMTAADFVSDRSG